MKNIFQNNIDLIERLIKGDEKAYIFLVNTYHKKIYVYALSLTSIHAMAEDIVQEVFLRTWKHRKKLKTTYSIQGFLYKATYNEFINQYHRNQSIMKLEKTFVAALKETVEDPNTISLDEKIALITKEIENLPSKCKQTFLLSKKEGLTNFEIAEYLNVSIKSVESHITKAYSLIRKK